MKQLTGLHPGGEIEFLRKRNNRRLNKSRKIRSIRLKSFHITLMILLFSLLGFGVFSAGKFIVEWKALSVTSFKLINPPGFSKGKIKKILKSYGGNILTVNLKRLRRDLMSLREVKSVNISRKLPSTLEIRFFLRKPVFQVVDGGNVKVVDREGVIIRESFRPEPGLIVIKKGKSVPLESVTRGLDELSRIRKSIDFISYRNPYGVVLKLKNSDELFYTGEKGFISRLNEYLKLRKRLVQKGNRIKVVDLRFRGRFYLEYEREVI